MKKHKWIVKPLFIEAIDKQTGKVYKDGFSVGFIGTGLVGFLNPDSTKRQILELKVIDSISK